jgi:plastocyanin
VKRALALLLAALAFAAAGCGGSDNSAETAAEGSHGTKDVSGMEEVDVELDDNYFAPTVLKGTAGQKIKLELENEGGEEHNFSLDEQGIDQDIDIGEDGEVDVTIPDSGELEFYCKYHREIGMTGKLEAG